MQAGAWTQYEIISVVDASKVPELLAVYDTNNSCISAYAVLVPYNSEQPIVGAPVIQVVQPAYAHHDKALQVLVRIEAKNKHPDEASMTNLTAWFTTKHQDWAIAAFQAILLDKLVSGKLHHICRNEQQCLHALGAVCIDASNDTFDSAASLPCKVIP